MQTRIATLPYLYDIRFKAPKMRTPETARVLDFMEVEIPVADAPPRGLVLHGLSYGVAHGRLWSEVGQEEPIPLSEIESACRLRGVWRHALGGRVAVHPLKSTDWPCVPAPGEWKQGAKYRYSGDEPRDLGDVLSHPTLEEFVDHTGRIRDLEDDKEIMRTLWRTEYAMRLMACGSGLRVASMAVPAWVVSRNEVEFRWDARRSDTYYLDSFAPEDEERAVAWSKVRECSGDPENLPSFLDPQVMAGLGYDRAGAVYRQLLSAVQCSDLRSRLNTGWCRREIETGFGTDVLGTLDRISGLAEKDPDDAAVSICSIVSLIEGLPDDLPLKQDMAEKTRFAVARWTDEPSVAALREAAMLQTAPDENDAGMLGFEF